MQVLLRVNTAGKPEKKIKVSRDVLIGRERGRCDLRVASSEVSRRHCQILVGEKTVDVRDLGSANGTRVNGELVPAKINFPVNPGDVLTVGPLEIRVEFQGVRSRSRPAAEPDDEFLSQDFALAALDAPGIDMDQSAPEILIKSRLIDSGDDYGSGLETVDASVRDKAGFAADPESFDSSSSDDSTPEQLAPLEPDDVIDDDLVELEPVELLEPLDEKLDDEQSPPVLQLHSPAEEVTPIEAVPIEPVALATRSTPLQPDSEDAGPARVDGKVTGRLKSLFGRFARKKADDESSAAPTSTAEAPAREPAIAPESVAVPEPAAEANSVAMPPELETPSVNLAVPAGGEVWSPPEDEWDEDDGELVSVEDVGSVDEAFVEDFDEDEDEELIDPAADDEDAPPADEGFADFLNHLDEPK